MSGLTYRQATASDAAILSDIAYRSKAHWGYSQDFMDACRAELSYVASDICAGDARFVVAELDGCIAGFVGLVAKADCSGEIDALFVDPQHIGLGIGKALMRRAIDAAQALGLNTIIIQADPNAASFYSNLGAQACGERESESIPGRMLPLYRLDV